ncbi:Triosephosphate isomerase [Hondaea fermentalgiana]|uniref:Triosephosphate isomerase n=1 Tax=Hondaea fermentalgiana TaxID=2315210 RepID=A0A2R5GPI3_9STRA|nr:Triosephosphate isomerase [Hondaea fermentalgiana]|eukprot:GBG30241.1 Triosephosphate isomerase [Hondaea fermentalgiana]
MAARRIPLVCGNFKLNGSRSMLEGIAKTLNGASLSSNVQVGVAPSAVHLDLMRQKLRSEVMVGAQDCWTKGSGAFTGETSADMLVDLGLEFSIVGHSERREKGETSAEIGEKAAYATSKGLMVIGCIGEKLEHRESGKTMSVITEQMQGYLAALKEEEMWSDMVLAYEPVWAIGTGKTASPEQAQEVHGELRDWLKTNISEKVAAETRILYGGSVTEKNCDELIKKEDIDGFLVGGASLKPEFVQICQAPGN